jgi:hypothetical protein
LAWTTPKTWSSAAITASEFNTHIRDNENWLKSALAQLNVTSDSAKAKITPALVGARVTRSADQSITTATQTAIAYDSETAGFDSDAFHDNATNNSRITIPSSFDGYYIFGSSIQFASNATGYRQVNLQLNGATPLAVDSLPIVAATIDTRITTSGLRSFAATDYIETIVTQTSGGNLNVEVVAQFSPWMWIHRLSSQ